MQNNQPVAALTTAQIEALQVTLTDPHKAMLIADGQERILHCNPAAERLFGLTTAQTLGQPLNKLIALQMKRKRPQTKAGRLLQMLGAKPVPLFGHHAAGARISLEGSLTQADTGGQTLFALTLRALASPSTAQIDNQSLDTARYAMVFNAAYEFLGLLRPDGTLLNANPAALDFVGATLADVQGRPFAETPWWACEEGRAKLQKGILAAADGEFVRFEARHHGVRGETITVDFSLKPVKDKHGKIILLIPEGRDITERKQHEAALQRAYDELERTVQERTAALQAEIHKRIEYEALAREREQFNLAVLGSLSHHIAIIDRTGTIVAVNQAWRAFAAANGAADGANTLGDNYLAVCHQAVENGELTAQQALAGIEAVLQGALHHFWLEYPCHSPHEQRWFLMEVTPLQSVQGGAVISHLNITERKRAESAARAEQARTASIVDSAMDAILSVDERHQIVLFNQAAERVFGYRASEMLGQPLARLLPNSLRATHFEHIQQFSQTGAPARAMGALGAVSGVRQNGEEFPIEAAISQTEADGQKLYTVILRDISRRREVEARLHEQAALLNQAREAILSSDLTGHIQFWNRGAELVYGWTAEEVLGRKLNEVVQQQQQPSPFSAYSEKMQTILITGEWQGELRHLTKAGREIIVDCHVSLVRDNQGQPASLLIINNDITEQKQIEARFLRAQRMESLGTLASGITHDLNNILSPLSMGLQLMQMKYGDEYAQKMLGMMNTSVKRAADLVKQILQFARGVSGERIALQLKHIIKELLKMLAETFPKSIIIGQEFVENPALVLGDATQLHQVLLNLCVNARDAMPNGGTLTIGLENTQLQAASPKLTSAAQPGPYLVLSVTDTGEGIAQEHLARIFDPFFTTKEAGKGTGLGLATVFAIVRAHDGFVTVESQVGRGTQFKVYLPAHTVSAASSVNVPSNSPPQGQGQLILAVDDEAAVREMHRVGLEDYGYRVLTAENSMTAIKLYAQLKAVVQLVITDVQMPGWDGVALVNRLRKLNPQLRVICCSGSPNATRTEELTQLNVQRVLPKPVNVETLLHAVAQALNER